MRDLLTEEQIREFETLFSRYDRDGDGSLSVDELREALADRGEVLDASSLQAMMAALDDDGNGTIDLDEFISGMAVYVLGSQIRP